MGSYRQRGDCESIFPWKSRPRNRCFVSHKKAQLSRGKDPPKRRDLRVLEYLARI